MGPQRAIRQQTGSGFAMLGLVLKVIRVTFFLLNNYNKTPIPDFWGGY